MRKLIAEWKKELDGDTRLLEWSVKWAAYLLTAASVVWTGLLSLAAKNELHLVAWVGEETVVYPSRNSWDRQLKLKYDGTDAKSVTLWAVKVSNYGKTIIGKQDALWQLSLEAPHAERLAVVGDLTATPKAVIVREIQAPKGNILALELGALEPRASIDFHLMLVNLDAYRRPPLRLQSTLLGLPNEVVPTAPSQLILSKIIVAVWVTMLLLVGLIFGPEQYTRARQKEKSGGTFAMSMLWSAVGMTVLAALLGVLVAHGLAAAIAWFL